MPLRAESAVDVADVWGMWLQLLYDTFSAFGMIIATPKIMRDPETGASRGFGFVSYESFEASDAAIEAMNGQFLCNRCAHGQRSIFHIARYGCAYGVSYCNYYDGGFPSQILPSC